MKKKFVLILAFALFLFPACSSSEKKITDFKKYHNLTRTPIEIRVNYQDTLKGEFVITDSDTIQAVTSILFDHLRYQGYSEPKIGGNGSMIFVSEDGTETVIGIHMIVDAKKYYQPTENTLSMKLEEIGLDYGALKPT